MANVGRSEQIGQLVKALATAQLTFDPILKESENPAFVRKGRASKYADMLSLVNATRKHLNANGLTIMQFPSITLEGKSLTVTTLLAHESGEWISSEILLPAADDKGFTAHSIGRAITYARRYSWGPIIGAVAEDDDDGNDASGQGTHEAAQAVATEKIAKARQKAQEFVETASQAREVEIKVLPNMDWAVTGNLEDKKIAEFLHTIEAKGFRAKEDGRYWFKASPEFLADFKTLCDRQEVKIL